MIGSGAAGLAAADALNQAGHFVTVFERAPQPGGRLRESVPEITTADIYIGVIPFVLIQFLALLVLWFAPGLATWLPHALYGS